MRLDRKRNAFCHRKVFRTENVALHAFLVTSTLWSQQEACFNLVGRKLWWCSTSGQWSFRKVERVEIKLNDWHKHTSENKISKQLNYSLYLKHWWWLSSIRKTSDHIHSPLSFWLEIGTDTIALRVKMLPLIFFFKEILQWGASYCVPLPTVVVQW